MNKRERGIALIIALTVIVILSILGTAILSSSISESRIARRYANAGEAFWLAEAGVNAALVGLRANFNLPPIGPTPLGGGQYQVAIVALGADERLVTATGTVGGTARNIEVIMSRVTPPGFYDNAIYCAGVVDLNGGQYTITNTDTGEAVIHAGAFDPDPNPPNPGQITGTVTNDATVNPLARLDFVQLRDMSSGQENVYVIEGNKLVNEATGSEDFPASFWFQGPDGVDNDGDGEVDEDDELIPNVVYVEGDLTLNGNIGTIGGFYVVVGDVINTPDVTQEAFINGNGMIEGCVYTRGVFRVNGGGGNLNINGGVWAGETARLNGNAHVTYNETFMRAIEDLPIDVVVSMTSWRDTQNPYQLQPQP